MDQQLKDKSGTVIVIDSSGAARTLLAEVVRSMGFAEVHSLPTVKDALSLAEAEPISWIITSLFADQPVNGMHLLKIVTEVPQLRNLRLSLMLEESEHHILPSAFELGLLSWHSKPFTKDTFTEDLRLLFETMEKYDYKPAMTAAHYLRGVLKTNGTFSELLEFEKKLLEAFPGETPLMLNFVEPMVQLDQKDDAVNILRQVKLLHPPLSDKVQELADELLDGATINVDDISASEDGHNFLGLKDVVIVDSDESTHKNISEILGSIGITDITCFSDGEAALNHLQEKPEPELLIQEWRIPKLTGPLLLQKAKSKGARSTPIVVLSSLIDNEDVPLLREMGVASKIDKPVERQQFLKNIIWTIQQDRVPTDQAQMERKMRDFLRSGNMAEAAKIKEEYMANPNIAEGMKHTIETEFAFYMGEYEKARQFGIKAIRTSGDSIFVLNLLGKTLMLLREFDIALRCFEKAQAMSPLNIERLCAIAEAHSELENEKEANDSIDNAKELDQDSERVKEAEAKIAMNAGNSAKAKAIMAELDAIENVVAYMNNQAIALARCNQIDQGINQYRKTLLSVPENRNDTKAIVLYNMALAHIRAQNLEDALKAIQLCIDIEQSRVHEKAKNIAKRLKRAIEKGEPLRLASASNGSDQPPNQENNSDGAASDSSGTSGEQGSKESEDDNSYLTKQKDRDLVATVHGNRGERACYLIFLPKKTNPEAQKLLKDVPRFRLRKAIDKDQIIRDEAS